MRPYFLMAKCASLALIVAGLTGCEKNKPQQEETIQLQQREIVSLKAAATDFTNLLAKTAYERDAWSNEVVKLNAVFTSDNSERAALISQLMPFDSNNVCVLVWNVATNVGSAMCAYQKRLDTEKEQTEKAQLVAEIDKLQKQSDNLAQAKLILDAIREMDSDSQANRQLDFQQSMVDAQSRQADAAQRAAGAAARQADATEQMLIDAQLRTLFPR